MSRKIGSVAGKILLDFWLAVDIIVLCAAIAVAVFEVRQWQQQIATVETSVAEDEEAVKQIGKFEAWNRIFGRPRPPREDLRVPGGKRR